MYEVPTDQDKIPLTLDYILCAASSDQRCYHVLDSLSYLDCKIQNIIIFNYQKLQPLYIDVYGQKRDNFNSLIQEYNHYLIYKDFATSFKTIACVNDNDDINFINTINFQENIEIGLDITGFTIPDLFRIFYFLKEIKHCCKIHVFYTEPEHYLFKKFIFDTYSHLSGQRTYKSLPEYFASGESTKELLILFLGFDPDISNYIYDKALPTEVIAINGFPSYLPKLKDISLLNNYPLITSHIDTNHKFYTRANNPFSTYNTLHDIREKYNDFLINICVLGSKPMALGACIFALQNKDNLKVTYPYPQEYSPNITKSRTKSWYYEINL